MNWLNTFLILVAGFLAVFWESAFQGLRQVLGVQVDLLAPLMVYAALSDGLPSVCLLAVLGGLWFDSLSANPLGTSVLPLFAVGLPIYLSRELVLRERALVQGVLGFVASAAVPVLNLLLLLTIGHAPRLGWGTLWQLVVLSVGGAVATPILFVIFAWLHRTFSHSRPGPSSFRPDREIRRGR